MTRLLAVAFKRVNELTRISIIHLATPGTLVPWAVSENCSAYGAVLCTVNKIMRNVAVHFAGIQRTSLFFLQKLMRVSESYIVYICYFNKISIISTAIIIYGKIEVYNIAICTKFRISEYLPDNFQS